MALSYRFALGTVEPQEILCLRPEQDAYMGTWEHGHCATLFQGAMCTSFTGGQLHGYGAKVGGHQPLSFLSESLMPV